MNREIKFEFIWKKKAILVKQVMTLDEIAECFTTPRMRGKNMPLIAKRQFTGLKDKNGVEIYEGDIVYIGGYGLYECEFPFLELYNAVMENDIGEIKGNIHENPALLKELEK